MLLFRLLLFYYFCYILQYADLCTKCTNGDRGSVHKSNEIWKMDLVVRQLSKIW